MDELQQLIQQYLDEVVIPDIRYDWKMGPPLASPGRRRELLQQIMIRVVAREAAAALRDELARQMEKELK